MNVSIDQYGRLVVGTLLDKISMIYGESLIHFSPHQSTPASDELTPSPPGWTTPGKQRKFPALCGTIQFHWLTARFVSASFAVVI
jgi:hypothetical protein